MNNSWFDNLIATLREAMASHRTSSAMRPLLPLVLAIAPLCLLLAFLCAGKFPELVYLFTAFGLFSVISYLAGYFYFALKDPHRLQSESFLLRQRGLDLIEQKGGTVQLQPSQIELLANPDAVDVKPNRVLESPKKPEGESK